MLSLRFLTVRSPAHVLCCGLLLHLILAAVPVVSAAESPATRQVRLELEQRTAERAVVESTRVLRQAAAAAAQQEIDRLQSELNLATQRLNQHQQAVRQAARAQATVETKIAELTEWLAQQRTTDTLRAAAESAQIEYENGQLELARSGVRLRALRDEVIAAGDQADTARGLAKLAAAEAADKEVEMAAVWQRAEDAERVLQSARVRSIRASGSWAEQQRRLSLATFEVNRARGTAERLTKTSQAINTSIRAWKAASPSLERDSADQIEQMSSLLEDMTSLQSRAEQIVAEKSVAAEMLNQQVTAAALAHEVAESDRRLKAERHAELNRQHFTLQRAVARLSAASEQQDKAARQQLARQEQLTAVVLQTETSITKLAGHLDNLKSAWLEAQQRVDEAIVSLSLVTSVIE